MKLAYRRWDHCRAWYSCVRFFWCSQFNLCHQPGIKQKNCEEFHVISVYNVFSSVQSLSRVRLFATPWIAACQASRFTIISRSSLRLTSIESVMPSSHVILCGPLLLLPPILSSIRVFSNESTLRRRWPKYYSFSFSISPSNGQDWFPLGWTGLTSLQSKGLSRVFSNTTVQTHQLFGT